MIKGVVVKVKSEYSIILSEGQFYRIKNKESMREGQKVIVTVEDIIKDQVKTVNKAYKKYIGIASAILLVISTLIVSFNLERNVYAVATIDINPRIELKLDKELKVKNMKLMNKEAIDFKSLKLKGLKVEDALELIVREAKNKGYIKDSQESYVLITTVKLKTTDKIIEQEIENKIKESQMLKKVNIAITATSKEIYKEHKEEKVPLGIKSLDQNIDENNYKSLNQFFKDKKNSDLFKKNGEIIENTKLKELEDESKNIEKSIQELKLKKKEIKASEYNDKEKKAIKKEIESAEEKLEERQEKLEDKIEDYKDTDDKDEDKDEDDDEDDEDEDEDDD